MSLDWTLALLVLGAGLTGFGRWHQGRAREPGEVSLVPATGLMAIGLVVSVVALAHLVSLLTGVPLRGRAMSMP